MYHFFFFGGGGGLVLLVSGLELSMFLVKICLSLGEHLFSFLIIFKDVFP